MTRYYDEVMNAHDPGAVDRLLSDDFVADGEAGRRSGRRAALSDLLAAFPDLWVETELILAEGDLVSVHQRWTGTHQGRPRTSSRPAVASSSPPPPCTASTTA